ncbi:cyclin-L1 [Folsomia candida]|uniref:cyclin-L1 n=1 Tax=Folsomia candida TaxID=158441 RepID=UPI001604C2B3|nr:cyclin-L1 [Folsomia candida]
MDGTLSGSLGLLILRQPWDEKEERHHRADLEANHKIITIITPPPTPGGGGASNSSTGGGGGVGSGNVTEPSTSSAPTNYPKIYGKIVLTSDNVLLDKNKCGETPSATDGMDEDIEWETRVVACELISSSGILLKLPQTAMATGQVLFHRFYYTKSFLRQDMEQTAMACIYLASKIEEAPRRIRDIINVFHHLQQLRSGKTMEPMVLDQSYIQLKSEVTLAERRVLKELGFCVHVKHPHKLIVVYMQQLGYDRDSQFVQMSWNYMSDALRSNVFVQYKPEAIACACIFLSARKLKIPLPSSPSWYIVFDVEEEHILDICETILELYQRPRIDYDVFMKKYKGLRKAFKESKDKAKAITIADKLAQGSNDANSSPASLPTSPKPGSEGSSSSAVQNNKEGNDHKRKLDAGDHVQKAPNSPQPKKSRRTPSPITFDDSPQRHNKKNKKRRKSRSDSSSRSRSRERRSLKKHSRREKSRSRSRSRSYSPKRSSHHKKSTNKVHHRYRSRSRSYSPVERDDIRYDRYYKKPKSSKHGRDEDPNKSRSRDKIRR